MQISPSSWANLRATATMMTAIFVEMVISLSIINDRHDFNLYITAFGDRITDFDHGAGRACNCKVLITDGGNFVVFAGVRDKEQSLHNIIQACSGFFKHPLDALEDEMSLRCEITGGNRRTIFL